MDLSILSRVQQAELDLFDALAGDDSDVERFARNWDNLSTDIQNAVHSNSLNESTMWTIHAISSHISVISQDLLDLHIHADALESDLMSELERMFTEISLEESPKAVHSTPIVTRPDSLMRGTSPYIEPSYRWLLQNLHDPYPLKETKESIARQTSCSVKDVENWFIEVRRKIGWNALRRLRFSNKRQSIVAAASSFFGKSNKGSHSQLCPDLELEFANIQSQAENLYTHIISERLPTLESDGDDRERRESGRPRKRRCSPSEQNNIAAPSRPCLKRRTDFPGRALHEGDGRVTDDIWSGDAGSRSSSIAPSQSSCSSPESSTGSLTPVSTTPNSLDSASVTTPLKRRRRLSLSDRAEIPKRPRIGCARPRLHAVSDPLPYASISLQPENNSFATDPSKFLEIELFDPSILFGSPEASCEAPQPTTRPSEEGNKSTLTPATDVLQGHTQTQTLATNDQIRRFALDNSGFNVQPPPTNNLPYLDIPLDGLTDHAFEFGTTFDWLTPFLDDTSFNGFLEPSSLFQMDLPPINDVFSLDYVSPVY